MPWEKAKGFDGAAQISRSFINKSELDLKDISFLLEKNGEQVQVGNSKDMLFSFDAIIAHISKFYTLKIGDLIYTGTPDGVGKVEEGDILKGFIGEKEMFKVAVK
jgi:2-keto-4-pentenoate hydratase/2-oxohepta-3-ene-1,7-dioic acid hydratase in catechol pathway